MEELTKYLNKGMDDNPYKIVLSGPRNKEEKYKKIVIEKKEGFFQASKYTGQQVFHDNIDTLEKLKEYTMNALRSYAQIHMFCDTYEYSLKISKKNKVLFNRTKNEKNQKDSNQHNKRKNYILEEGERIEPLIDVGIFTKEGKVVHSMYDKFKQINRFLEIIDDAVKKANLKEITILDFGCGKSYLTFILYHYFTKIKNIDVRMIGL
ncbi:MAG: methyltransferase, partial [Peptostreptococcales bacterium]